MIPGMVPDEATHMRLTYSLASQIMGVEQDKITLRGEEKYIYDRLPTSPNIDSYDYSYTHFFSGEDNGEYVTIDADSANWKQLFGYFPAVIGVVFSRLMHFGATPTINLSLIHISPVTIYIGEDAQRPLSERVANFIPRICENYTIIDSKDYELKGIKMCIRDRYRLN